jgi:NADPH2:quinone reductase
MRAVQIVDLSGPDSALALVELEEPEPSSMLTPGSGVLIDVHAAGSLVPRGAADARPVPAQTAAAVRARQRGRRRRSQRAGGGPGQGGRPRGRVLRARRLRRDGRGGRVLHVRAAPRAGLRPGRGADPQLPHRLLRARAARAPEAQARRCSSTARPAGWAPPPAGRQGLGARTIALVSSDAKQRGRRAGRSGSGAALAGAVEGRGARLSGGGVDVVLDPVGGDRFTDSLRSLRENGRVVVVGFTGGSIPEVKVNRLLLGTPRWWGPAGAPT